jgi:3-mercaptopyruvate sulfurtransferase SseA
MTVPCLAADARHLPVFRLLLTSLLVAAAGGRQVRADEGNRLIDYAGFTRQVAEVGALRESRRVSEDEFLELARDPATVILDARSAEKYRLLHVRGARNLSLPDMTEAELAAIIPDKRTRVLIYCNNNFENEVRAFPAKSMRASLNVHTFNVLHAYGYENVHELKPLLDVSTTRIPFAGELADRTCAAPRSILQTSTASP